MRKRHQKSDAFTLIYLTFLSTQPTNNTLVYSTYSKQFYQQAFHHFSMLSPALTHHKSKPAESPYFKPFRAYPLLLIVYFTEQTDTLHMMGAAKHIYRLHFLWCIAVVIEIGQIPRQRSRITRHVDDAFWFRPRNSC